MTREEKQIAIDQLSEKLATSGVFYLADASALSADATSQLRRLCFNRKLK
jgi:large subunit ribosomal protein L10